MLKRICILLVVSAMAVTSAVAASEFESPVMMKAAGKPIRVEAPGYAAPSWVDVDGDGDKDLEVGQFNDGKMHVYRNLGDGEFAERTWLEAEGQG